MLQLIRKIVKACWKYSGQYNYCDIKQKKKANKVKEKM